MDHRLGEHGCGGGAIASDVIRLGGNFLGQLGAKVLKRVFKFNFARNGHTIVGDCGRAPLLVNDDIAALGAKRHFDDICKCIDACLKAATCILIKFQNLCHGIPLLCCCVRS